MTTSTPSRALNRPRAATIAAGAAGPWTRVSATTSRTGRVPRGDRGHHVAARRGVDAGEQPDGAGEARQPPLPLGCEEPLGLERATQPHERDRMIALADPLERCDAEAELAPGLVELEPAVDLDALALGERR